MPSGRPNICLLILDLDNTLYDWVGFFVPAFNSMVDVASSIMNVPRDEVLHDLQVVHQQYGNSEHPYALLEAKVVLKCFPGKSRPELADILDPAFHAFNKARREHLRLFPNVRETLDAVKASGCTIVAHTEAIVPHGLFRLRMLDVLRDLDRLYAPLGTGLGHPRGREIDTADLPQHFLRLLPPNHRKPDPHVVADILADYATGPERALYVGDSITRDVMMAKEAGIYAAWAKYGTLYDKVLWEQLVRVTHWTKSDVERENALKSSAARTSPDAVLDSFGDLLRYFAFGRGVDG
jgi:phosphoglycolate phosphatase